MAIQYQTLQDGTVETWDGSAWVTPMPTAAEIALFDKQTAQWFGIAQDAVNRYGLPYAITFAVLAIIYSESDGGIATLGPSFDGGVGLMAITAKNLKEKPGGGYYSSDELKDPHLNVDIGVGKMIAPEYAIMGMDLPQIASGYNGGFGPSGAHHSPNAPWGWKEYVIPKTGAQPYISKVVRMNNYALSSLGGAQPAPPDTTDGGGIVEQASAGPAVVVASVVLLLTWLWRTRS